MKYARPASADALEIVSLVRAATRRRTLRHAHSRTGLRTGRDRRVEQIVDAAGKCRTRRSARQNPAVPPAIERWVGEACAPPFAAATRDAPTGGHAVGQHVAGVHARCDHSSTRDLERRDHRVRIAPTAKRPWRPGNARGNCRRPGRLRRGRGPHRAACRQRIDLAPAMCVRDEHHRRSTARRHQPLDGRSGWRVALSTRALLRGMDVIAHPRQRAAPNPKLARVTARKLCGATPRMYFPSRGRAVRRRSRERPTLCTNCVPPWRQPPHPLCIEDGRA